jgi:hypothetical protein
MLYAWMSSSEGGSEDDGTEWVSECNDRADRYSYEYMMHFWKQDLDRSAHVNWSMKVMSRQRWFDMLTDCKFQITKEYTPAISILSMFSRNEILL